ncbi:MAG: CAP domain-containing protein [Candidatus Sulfotelmatobacter sp.]
MRIFLRLALLVCLLFSLSAATCAQTGASAREQQLFSLVNQMRQDRRLPALRWNEALAVAARRHAAVMAEHGVVEHVFAGEPTLASRAAQTGLRFSWLAENVAQSATIENIHAEFRKSPNHRANILDSDMDSIGIGVVERGGRLFAVEDFCKAK